MEFFNMNFFKRKLNPKKMERIFAQKDKAAEEFLEL